jgi:gluconolactonase
MALDERGNIYAAYKGVVAIDPEGRLIGRIAVPEQSANCTFGGPELRTLYITARTGLYAVEMKVRGMALLGPKGGAKPEEIAAPPGKTRDVKAGTLTLKAPESWKEVGPDGQMRANQFQIPPAAGDREPADLVVYYFGAGGAGGLSANVRRWIGQFDPEGRQVRITKGKNGAGEYTIADVSGTYQKSIGPPIQGKKQAVPGSRMLAAIVDSPEGPYFLKLTGPKATVAAEAAAFRASFGADPKGETELKPEGY